MSNEAMVNNLTNILNGLDDSQEKLEKDAFDVINSSDTSLNLVKESMSSVEEILGMIESMNKVVEESSSNIRFCFFYYMNLLIYAQCKIL